MTHCQFKLKGIEFDQGNTRQNRIYIAKFVAHLLYENKILKYLWKTSALSL